MLGCKFERTDIFVHWISSAIRTGEDLEMGLSKT